MLLTFKLNSSGGNDYYNDSSRIVGMRPTMENKKIHLIYFDSGGSDGGLRYVVLDTTAGTTIAKSFLIWKPTMIYESIFIEPTGSPNFKLDSSDD